MIYLLNIAFAVLIIAPDDHAAEAVKYALLGTVAANLAIEARELAQDQLDYFSSVWNWLDLSSLAFSITTVALHS